MRIDYCYGTSSGKPFDAPPPPPVTYMFVQLFAYYRRGSRDDTKRGAKLPKTRVDIPLKTVS